MRIVEELQAVLDRYAALYNARDAAGIAAMFAQDARIYSPFGPPSLGRDAIRRDHEGWFAYDEQDKRLRVVEAHVGGDLAYCLASYAAEVIGETGAPETLSGMTVGVLRRGDGGAWEFLVASLTHDESAPT